MDILYRNLNVLVLLNPNLSSPALLKCIHKKLFHVPDKNAFHLTIHFLLNVICPQKCKNGYIWPVLNDRLSERQFLTGIRSIIMELKEENPQSGIPSFQTSFLANPCGVKFLSLMLKICMLALELCTQDTAVLNNAGQGSASANSYQDLQLKLSQLETKYLTTKLEETDIYIERVKLESTEFARGMIDKWKEVSSQITEKETELSNYVGKSLAIPDALKASILDVRNQQVLTDWSSEIETKTVNNKKLLEKLKECDSRMDAAFKCVVSATALYKDDLCLDGSLLLLKCPVANLELLAPGIKSLQVELFASNGAVRLSSLVLISKVCLQTLLDAIEKKNLFKYIRSIPHTAIREQSLRLNQLSQSGDKMLQTLYNITTDCNTLIDTIINNSTMSDLGKEWMERYQIYNLMPPPPFVLKSKNFLNEVDCEGRDVDFPKLIPNEEHEEHLKAIISCQPDMTPPRSFFLSAPVADWLIQPQRSKPNPITVPTEKKCIPKASRLPVLCTSTLKYSSSVTARSRLMYSSENINKDIEENDAPGLDIVPTPNVRRNIESSLCAELSPLATELPETPETLPIKDVHLSRGETNTPDILNHTYISRISDVISFSQTDSDIRYAGSEFDESCISNVEILDVSSMLNSGLFSPTESVSSLSEIPFNCRTPVAAISVIEDEPEANCFTPSNPNDSPPTLVSNVCSVKANGQTPTESKKGKTPSTLERIILRYKKFKESK